MSLMTDSHSIIDYRNICYTCDTVVRYACSDPYLLAFTIVFMSFIIWEDTPLVLNPSILGDLLAY